MTSKDVVPASTKTAAQMREEERARRSNMDQILLRNARLSPQELSERTGMPVDEAVSRLYELLRTRDHLTDRQEERLLIIEMGDLIDEMRDRATSANDENYADIANAALRGYEAIAKRLDARRKIAEIDISQITRAQGEMFLAIMIETVNNVATWLEELHPDNEWDIRSELEEGFAEQLARAREEVNNRVRE